MQIFGGLGQKPQQRAKLDRQIRQERQKLKTEERKKATRRKILVGSYYLDKAEKSHSMDQLTQLMDSYLTRDDDRALFNLPPKGTESGIATNDDTGRKEELA